MPRRARAAARLPGIGLCGKIRFRFDKLPHGGSGTPVLLFSGL
jgi:hypothetical protein